MTTQIELARTDEEIARCHAVMVQLRQQLSHEEFCARARRQIDHCGYELVQLSHDGDVRAVAGFRVSENLAWGKYLYVDDLVTDETTRSMGHGEAMLRWLIERARSQDCDELHLDSAVQRFAAHRFYLRHRMQIASHHFSLSLK